MTLAHKQQNRWPALPITLLFLAFTMPPETSVLIGSFRLSPYRIVLLIWLFPALNKVMSDTRNPMGGVDALMGLHSFWAALSIIITMGLAGGFETAGIYVIETFGVYLIARAYIRTVDDYTNLIWLIFSITAALLAFAALESFSGFHILRESFQAILGGPGPHAIEPRLGLTRAFTSFEHPILFGVFAASGFAGTYYLLCDGKLNFGTGKKLGAIAAATFFSLSGGPFTALAFQMGLIGWDRLTATISYRWSILVGLFLFVWLVLALVSNRSPILIFISYLTFSANSAYNRVHIWDYGTAEVARHPLFGIGLNDWVRAPWMSDSMDNFWLLTTVRYGLPALIFLFCTVLLIAYRFKSARQLPLKQKNAIKAWLVTLAGFTLAGLTVHFWNALMVQLFFFLGCGVALAGRQPVTKTALRQWTQNSRRLAWS